MARNIDVLLLCVLAGACVGDAGSDGHRAVGGKTSEYLQVAVDLRIDGMAADLVPIGGVAVAKDGTIALVQAQDHKIRFFDANGEDVGSFGRRGEGPGEFESMSPLGWLADTLVVYDGELRRFTLVSGEFELVRTVPAPVVVRFEEGNPGEHGGSALAIPKRLYADGTVYAGVLDQSGGDEAVWVRISADGVVVSNVLRYSAGRATVSTIRTRADGVGGIRVSVPFAWRSHYDLSPDGSRATLVEFNDTDADVGTFQVTIVSPRGDTVLSRAYPFELQSIPRNVADSAVEATASKWQDSNAELAAAIRREARVAEFYPPVEGVVNGRDGTIWIGLREVPDGRPYLLLDSMGGVVGSVLLPHAATVRVADRWNVWSVESDENDVQSIVRYRVMRD